MKKFGLGLIVLALGACVPKIYVIDRQTVLEDEAAGEWPEYERRLLPQVQEKTPTPSAKVQESEKRRRVYRVLNGNVVGQTAPPPVAAPERTTK